MSFTEKPCATKGCKGSAIESDYLCTECQDRIIRETEYKRVISTVIDRAIAERKAAHEHPTT